MCKRLRSSSTKDRINDLPNLQLPSDEVSDLLQLPWDSTKRLRCCLPKNMINDLPNKGFSYGEVFDLQWGSTKRLPFCSVKDRISDLPDSILCHILSFLPTNLTVVTSILSKRWKTLYHYVPSYIMYKPFIKSHHLWAALRCRDTEFPIPLFRLFCHRRDVYNPLIMTAIKRGVETLELNILSSPLEMSYLSEILTCKTLTVLKLTSLIIKEPDFPQINVSSIKTLHLNTINFVHTTCMISFFLAFPNLEELQTDDVNHIMGRKVIPQTKCLLNLVRANTSDIELIPVICFSRALTLNVNKVPLISIVQLPVFYNLTQLELFFTFKQTWHQKWQWILKLLQQSHKLQHLTIHEEIQNETEMNDENWEEPQTVPECLSSQLKTCLFKYYRGTSSELKFAKYVMQNSKVLLSMTIHCSYVVDLKAKYQILQKLSLCLRSCKLIFD